MHYSLWFIKSLFCLCPALHALSGSQEYLPEFDRRCIRLSNMLFIIKYSINVFRETLSTAVQIITIRLRHISLRLAGWSPTNTGQEIKYARVIWWAYFFNCQKLLRYCVFTCKKIIYLCNKLCHSIFSIVKSH